MRWGYFSNSALINIEGNHAVVITTSSERYVIVFFMPCSVDNSSYNDWTYSELRITQPDDKKCIQYLTVKSMMQKDYLIDFPGK